MDLCSQQATCHSPSEQAACWLMASRIPCNKHMVVIVTDFGQKHCDTHPALYHPFHLTAVTHRLSFVIKLLLIKGEHISWRLLC